MNSDRQLFEISRALNDVKRTNSTLNEQLEALREEEANGGRQSGLVLHSALIVPASMAKKCV